MATSTGSTQDLDVKLTFRDGVLNLSALDDDILVVDAFLLFDEVVAVAVLACGGWSLALGREFHARDNKPLH